MAHCLRSSLARQIGTITVNKKFCKRQYLVQVVIMSPFVHQTHAYLLFQKALKFSVEPTLKVIKSITPHYPKTANYSACLIITIKLGHACADQIFSENKSAFCFKGVLHLFYKDHDFTHSFFFSGKLILAAAGLTADRLFFE